LVEGECMPRTQATSQAMIPARPQIVTACRGTSGNASGDGDAQRMPVQLPPRESPAECSPGRIGRSHIRQRIRRS
jgi:hypothetical protein